MSARLHCEFLLSSPCKVAAQYPLPPTHHPAQKNQNGEISPISGELASLSTNLSKIILTAKIPKARGKAVNKCPALGYSTPGAESARSAQVTLCGSQNLSFQNQAERAAMFHGDSVHGRWEAISYLSERKYVWKLLNASSATVSLIRWVATLNFTAPVWRQPEKKANFRFRFSKQNDRNGQRSTWSSPFRIRGAKWSCDSM